MELVTQIGDAEPRPLEVPMHVVQLPASLGTGTKRYVWTLVTGYREYIREEVAGFDDTDDTPALRTYVVGHDRNGDLIDDDLRT